MSKKVLIIILIILVISMIANKHINKKETVYLYYYNAKLDQDDAGNILCSKNGLVKVLRDIPASKNIIQDTIELLIKGELTLEEKEQGLTTEYPLEGLSLAEVNLSNGKLIITLNDPYNKTSGGSCRATILRAQIEATVKQFSEVKEIYFEPDYLFQP